MESSTCRATAYGNLAVETSLERSIDRVGRPIALASDRRLGVLADVWLLVAAGSTIEVAARRGVLSR
jgi:hypothetical protein